jgi:hypothetical protein
MLRDNPGFTIDKMKSPIAARSPLRAANAVVACESEGYFSGRRVIGEGTMYYVLIAFLAVVVVAFAEAKTQFRRRSRANSAAHEKGRQ